MDYRPDEPQPIAPPAVVSPSFDLPPPKKEQPAWIKKLGPIGTFLVFLAAKAKAILYGVWAVLKFAKLGKVLLTSGSMLLSVWAYSTLFGWPFALGFVILIFIHEMGHVFVAWRQGHPVSAPIFVPFMGALILAKFGKSVYADAVMGIGGPVGGTIGSLLCWAIYDVTGQGIFLGLAYVGFFMNLFNLTPVFPLDGGWIVAAISPYLWALGLAIMAWMFVSGQAHNPMIVVLILMALPRLIQGLKSGRVNAPGDITTSAQKWTMGLAYVGLAGFLVFAMSQTDIRPSHRVTPSRSTQPLALGGSRSIGS